MSPSVNKFLPPGMVVAATLYFGWPPAEPLIQSDSTVRATAVRWKRDDLKKPAPVSIDVDPFASVLVVSDELEVEEETGKLVPATRPAGPDPTVLQQGLVLSGIADMGGRKWAILNGRPRLPGDTLVTADLNRHLCQVVSVGHDHVVVRCEETIAQVEIRNSKQNSSASNLPGVKLHPVTEIESAATDSAATNSAVVDEASEIPPPPNFTLSHNQTSLRRNPCRTY